MTMLAHAGMAASTWVVRRRDCRGAAAGDALGRRLSRAGVVAAGVPALSLDAVEAEGSVGRRRWGGRTCQAVSGAASEMGFMRRRSMAAAVGFQTAIARMKSPMTVCRLRWWPAGAGGMCGAGDGAC